MAGVVPFSISSYTPPLNAFSAVNRYDSSDAEISAYRKAETSAIPKTVPIPIGDIFASHCLAVP